MEDKEDIIGNLQQDQRADETNKVIENEIEVKVEERQIESSKKSKQSSKQNLKAKVTVPRPFSLATEQRMSRERRGSMDIKPSKPTLTKSACSNYRNMDRSSLGAERSADQRGGSSTKSTPKTSLRPKVISDQQVDKKVMNGSKTKDKIQVKEVAIKKPQVNAKKQEGDGLGSNKLQKSLSFKASPLQNFYHRKDPPPKPEIKKILLTHSSKPPMLGQQGKIVAKSEGNKSEEKGKRLSRTVSSSTQDSISKIFRTGRSPVTTPKEMPKGVVSTA